LVCSVGGVSGPLEGQEDLGWLVVVLFVCLVSSSTLLLALLCVNRQLNLGLILREGQWAVGSADSGQHREAEIE
jgi:hypothetical protein